LGGKSDRAEKVIGSGGGESGRLLQAEQDLEQVDRLHELAAGFGFSSFSSWAAGLVGQFFG
jgi:hypothetical protein